MTASEGPPTWIATQDQSRLGLMALLIIATLGSATFIVVWTPGLPLAIRTPELDVVTHTLGATVCALAAALSYTRRGAEGRSVGLLESAAFLVLATANLLNVLVLVTGVEGSLGMSMEAPGQIPLYFWSAARILAAASLAAGASTMLATRIRRAEARLVLLLPTAVLLGVALVLVAAGDAVPVLVDPTALRQQVADPASPALLAARGGQLLLDGASAVLLGLGAYWYARAPHRDGGIPRPYMVAGLLFAMFSQIQFILYPAVYAGLVSIGDGLRIVFYFVLLAGVLAASRADMLALRQANSRLRLLAAAEADRTAIAERARLARELHDGLAQDLWTAQLELDRLAADLDRDDPAAGERLQRARHALDEAGNEARAAVATLRAGFDAGLSFADELPRRIRAFGDRTGYPVDLTIEPGVARLSGVAANEALRVIDEALHNVAKHADATRIRVHVAQEGTRVVVTVEDNGRGFAGPPPETGHGIEGMRERAALLGGDLDIRSSVGGGTSVRLRVPESGTST
jgi:signal transduction histidine kinase